MRVFNTGATRNDNNDKFDYEGFLSPFVLERYAQYLHKHRKQTDGKMRDADNWQKGIPTEAYMESLLRHVMEVWKDHRGAECSEEEFQDSLCAIIFNAMGYLFEEIKDESKEKNICKPRYTWQVW
jgi:hypothetical protein